MLRDTLPLKLQAMAPYSPPIDTDEERKLTRRNFNGDVNLEMNSPMVNHPTDRYDATASNVS